MMRDHHLRKHHVTLVETSSAGSARRQERDHRERESNASLQASCHLDGACGDCDGGGRQEADCDTKGTGSPCSKVDGAEGGRFGLTVGIVPRSRVIAHAA
jgi:hypothetical protein